MKAAIARYLREVPTAFRIARRLYHLLPNSSVQKVMQRRLRDIEAGFFVQVGANDGMHGDPLHQLIVEHPTWTGIFVEPVPFLMERLKQQYGETSGFIFEQVAIGPTLTVRPFYYVAEEAAVQLHGDVPIWYDQLGSFNREHIVRHLNGRLEPYIVETAVECIPLPELLSRHRVNRLDLFHVDVEGFDYEVLRQLDLDRYRPAVILYEHRHLPEDQRTAARSMLRRVGYRLSEWDGDTLALRRSQR